MAETRKIEYRVKAVERYIVTRYHEDADGRSVVVERGTFSSPYIALEVAHALGKADQSAAAPHTSVQYPDLLDPNVPQDGQLQEMIENKANYLAGDRLGPLPARLISKKVYAGELAEQAYDVLRISYRTSNRLKPTGIRVGDLIQLYHDEGEGRADHLLLSLRGLGKRSLQEIKEAIAEFMTNDAMKAVAA